MKAAVVERPGVLMVRDVPQPPVEDYDALCELLYGATCSGTDLHIINGTFPWPPEYPTIIGHESIGRVIKTGPKARNYKVGDLVTRVGSPPVGDCSVTWGGFAEYGVARDHRAMKADGCARDLWYGYRVNQVLPPETDPAAATMIITWRETLSYMLRMGVHSGACVLIMGSGSNGFAMAAHARNLRAAYVAMIGSPGRKGAADALDVDLYVDYRAGDCTDVLSQACSEGFDFIIDAVGKKGQIDRVLKRLKPGGTVSIYGLDDFSQCSINPHNAPGAFTFRPAVYDEEEAHEAVINYMRDGALDASVFLDLSAPYPLSEIRQAVDAVRKRRHIKALVSLSTDQ